MFCHEVELAESSLRSSGVSAIEAKNLVSPIFTAGPEGVGEAVGEGVVVAVGGVGVADGAGVGVAVGTCVGVIVALARGVLAGAGLSGGVAMAVSACARMVDTVASGVVTVEATCVSVPLIAQAKLNTTVSARRAEESLAVTVLRKMHQSRAVAAAFARFRLEGASEWMASEVFAHGVA